MAVRGAVAVSVILSVAVVLAPMAAPVVAADRPAVDRDRAAPTAAVNTANVGAARIVSPTTAELRSGEEYWQGWRVRFDATAIISDPASASARQRTFQIRRVVDGSRVGELLQTFTVDRNGSAVIDTSRLRGPVVIQHQGDTVYVADGTGYTDSPPDGVSVTVANSAWQVTRQTLQASWTDRTVYNGQITTLRLQSNRENYRIAVSGTNLTYTDLLRIFPESAYADNFYFRAAQDVLLLEGGSEVAYNLNVSGIEPRTLAIRTQVVDSTATARPLLTVKQAGKNYRFSEIQRFDEAGDIIPVTVNCGECYLVVGGTDVGFIDIVRVSDRSGSGSVSFRINTRYLGTGNLDIPAYTSANDTVELLGGNKELTSPKIGDESTIAELWRELDVGRRSQPLESGTVDIRVVSSLNIRANGGELVIADEQNMATIKLRERSLESIQVSTLPSGSPAVPINRLTNLATKRSEIALGDRLILRIDASGIYGQIDGRYDNTLRGVTGGGLELTIASESRSNEISLADRRSRLITDPAHNRFFVVIDTRFVETDEPLQPGETFQATFSVTGGSYPYLDRGESERVRTDFTFVEQTASFDQNTLQVTNALPVSISGTTTVAPRSTIVVKAVAEESNWVKRERTIVRSDGTWSVPMDFSNAEVGESFTVTVVHDELTLAERGGSVVTSATPTPTPSSTGSTGGTATGTTTATTTGTGTATATPDSGATSTDTPAATPTDSSGGLLSGIPFVPSINLPVQSAGLPNLPWLLILGVVVVLAGIGAAVTYVRG
ncbi:MAG: hypothetical protein SVG88_11690 [Halobacteriales archaeon]|nr:hypothetical protein [Halobacteriales archaeon]